MSYYIQTKSNLIANVAESFFQNYAGGYYWERPAHCGRTHKETHRLLCLASERGASVEELEAILGNKSWTTLPCQECKKDADAVAVIYADESSAWVCAECLVKMLAEMDPQ